MVADASWNSLGIWGNGGNVGGRRNTRCGRVRGIALTAAERGGHVTSRLTGRQARHLRRLAHHLDPVVLVGERGVSPQVIAATDEALEHHELIKVRATGAERDEVREAADALCAGTGAVVAQVIGKVIVLYRPRSKDPRIRLPPAGDGRFATGD